MLVCKSADNRVRWQDGERLEQLFEDRCDRVPADHLAVVTDDASLTFRELDHRANQTARYLIAQGVKAGDRIGLLFGNSVHSYVALLAVLKTGAAYVPLDASFPSERIRFILEDAGVSAIVSVSEYEGRLTEFPVTKVFLDTAHEISVASPLRFADYEKPRAADQLFYIIYTSGTTGKPKGVAIEHSGICNFVRVAEEVYGISAEDRCYQGMSLAFDFHVESLWLPMICGATLIGGKSSGSLIGSDLHDHLMRQRVTVLPCVPTLWATIEKDLPGVRLVLLSGESVPHHLVVRWHRPDRVILNAYGPTECSVSSTIRRLTPDRPVTIGTPLPTYTVVILNEDKDELVDEGTIGEIGIAGVALARGYLNREELTRKKFIPDFLNLANNPSKRIYRTGDYGRIRADGELEFHGRIDTQIKIRGYRVELEEIEAVLAELPEIAQVVVSTHEPAPGAVDLVAHFTRTSGAPDLSSGRVVEALRSRLPGYMVPAFFEEVAAIPMTSNGKVDRKALPAPKGQRLTAGGGKVAVAPRSATEQLLADALSEVMAIERPSIEDDFFLNLGAHSLLMARFAAEIRKRMKITNVSMREIYQNPTIEKLAHHLEAQSHQASGNVQRIALPEPHHQPSDRDYYLCGALQLVWYAAWSSAVLWIVVESVTWTYASLPDSVETYFRVLMVMSGLSVLLTALPIAAKWLLIGTWKPETIPIWSLRYFRFWVVRYLIRTAPMASFGDPFYNLYLRLLGAKVGPNAVIHTKYMPVCTDLISIGDHAVLSKDSILLGYTARSNYLHIGPVDIGSGAYVGEGGVLDINTIMEDNTQLGTGSSLHAGQRLPKGKHFHGTPGQETAADYCRVAPQSCTPLRRWTYAIVLLATGFALAPIPLLVAYYLFPGAYDLIGGSDFAHAAPAEDLLALCGRLALLTLTTFFGVGILVLLYIGIVPRLLNFIIEKDKSYVLYGVHYFIHRWIDVASNSVFFNRLFGDASAIVQYVQWAGYQLNKIVQTGSNFGLSQRHDNPFLCEIGSGTMVSGGLKMVNETMSSTSFKVSKVTIGERSYLGNYIYFPADASVGTNCLVATRALVPIDGPVRENVGLLGSPSFEIPRANERDKELARMDETTRRLQLAAKNRYNLATAILYLLSSWMAIFLLSLTWTLGIIYYPVYGMAAILAAAALAFLALVTWHWFVERASLRFGRLTPRIVPLLHPYFWFHERSWKLTGLWFIAPAFGGTPFKNLFSRLEGVRVGRKVFDDGCYFDEYSLIEIGDGANLNADCVIQPHSLEEGVFKSGTVKIGKGCTLGVASNLHYDIVMGDHCVLDTNAFLMKGEIVESHSVWQGNPARAVGPVSNFAPPDTRPQKALAQEAARKPAAVGG